MSGDNGFTNKRGLPEWYHDLYWAFNYDATSGGKRRSDFSATGLIKPTQITVLGERYGDLVTEDIADCTWKLLGSAAHSAMYSMQKRSMARMVEEGVAPRVRPVLERRMYTSILIPGTDEGMVTISGAPDRICIDGVTRDFKFTSAWTHVFRSRDREWKRQLAIYNWLGFMYGMDVANQGEICAIFRDWDEKKMMSNDKYPRINVGFYEFDLPSPAATARWIQGKVEEIFACRKLPDDEQPECIVGGEEDDVWASEEKWAYYKSDKLVKATKLFTSEEEAQKRLDVEGKGHIVHRPGERKRCAGYCGVAPWCAQYGKWRQEQGLPPLDVPTAKEA